VAVGADWWADEVRADEAKLVAATSGPEGGRKRLAALSCSQRKGDGVGFSVAPALLARHLEDGHCVGKSKQARVHSPGACSPPLLIDGCAANMTLRYTESREAGSFAWRSAARRGQQKGFGLNDERIGTSSGGGWCTWGR
jgi:hypothetical protein